MCTSVCIAAVLDYTSPRNLSRNVRNTAQNLKSLCVLETKGCVA